MNKLSESFSTINLNTTSNNQNTNQQANNTSINQLNNSNQYIHTNNRSRSNRNNITQQVIDRAPLPQKNIKLSPAEKRYFRDSIQVVTNFYNFDFKKIRVDEIFLYAITVEDYKGKENPHYGLIKRLSRSADFKACLLGFFADFWITGNTLFGEPLAPEDVLYEFAVYYFENQDKIIPLDEISKYPSECVYVFRIAKKFNIKDFESKGVNASLTERQHITRFMSSMINRSLEKNNYKKTDSSQRSLHYKMDPADYIYTDSEIYFVSGIKIITNFHDQQQMLCKAVQKFRMLRKQTYLDLWKWCLENHGRDCQSAYYNYCIGKEGFTIYSEKNIKIDGVEFNITPATYYIKQATGVEITLIQYYAEKYKLNITDPNQPLFMSKKIRKTKDKSTIEETIYFVPELLFIMGKMSFDNLNIARYTLLKPEEKFSRTNNIMRIIRDFQNKAMAQKALAADAKKNVLNSSTVTGKNSNSNSNKNNANAKTNNDNKITERNINFELQKIQSYVLTNPKIEVTNNCMQPDFKTAEFDMKNQIPLENESIKNWVIFLYDVEEPEWVEIRRKMLISLEGFQLKIESDPVLRVINPIAYKTPKSQKMQQLQEVFNQELKTLHDDTETKRKTNKEFKYDIIIYILSNREKDTYMPFKEAINNSKLCIPSQVFKKENVLKKDLSVISNIFLQIWAKNENRIWRTEKIEDESKFLNDTMICSYAIAKSSLHSSTSVTSICGSYDRTFSQYCYFSDFHSYSGKTSPVICKLFELVLKNYLEWRDKLPKKVIIYREGVNPAQRKFVLENEFAEIKTLLQKDVYKNIKITFIFVNSHCETKLYQEVANKVSKEGLEIFDLSIDSNKQNSLANVLPGTIIDNTITSDTEWDFYLVSTVSIQGTSNPTHYVVYFDETGIKPALLYKLTYDLTFLYYNNQKCVRLPAPLKNSVRTCNFIAKYLREQVSKKLKFNNIAL